METIAKGTCVGWDFHGKGTDETDETRIFPQNPYEELFLESLGNFAGFISFVSSRKTRYGPV